MAILPKKSRSSRRTASSTPAAAAEPPAAPDPLAAFLLPASGAVAAWAVFDPAWYVAAHGLEVAPAGAATHYIEHGQALGLSPGALFDEAWYRASYPDAAQAIADGHVRSGFEHYCMAGHADRSPHWLFDHVLYRDDNPDVTDAVLRDGGHFNLYDHMLRAGCAQGRAPHRLFDPVFHASNFTGDAGLQRLGPFRHWLGLAESGSEPQASPLFDPAWYRGFHDDADAAIRSGACGSALHHYLTNAAPTHHDPLPDFSEAFYLGGNPDAAALVAAGVFRCGYDHYLQHGAVADRAPGPWLDPAAYRAAHAEVDAAVIAGRSAHAFAHALGAGAQRGLSSAAGMEAVDGGGLAAARARSGIAFHAGAAPSLSVIAVLPPRPDRALATLAAVQGCVPAGTGLFLLAAASDHEAARGLFPGAVLLACDDPTALPRARNQALAQVAGGLVLFVNAGAQVPADSLAAAIRCMDDPSIGAVGGPVMDRHGRLLGAGGVVCNDGARRGYMRGAAMDAAEAGFMRDVDYCSGDFLLARAAVLAALGGFAEDIGDTDAADADLCLRIWQSGYRVTYHPRVALVHADPRGLRAAAARRDLAAPGSPAAAPGLDRLLLQRHPSYLERRTADVTHAGRTPRRSMDSVLVLMPAFTAADAVRTDLVPRLVRSGADVTVFPLDGGPTRAADLPRDLADSVEVITGVGEAGLTAFLAGRQGCFSRVEYATDAIASQFRGQLTI